MVASVPVPYMPISGQCTIVPCLNQVAGYVDNNPAAQLSACQSVFGFPTVPTVTLQANPILSTRTATYTDTVIVVTTSTAYTTVGESSTSYETVLETATEYSTTLVSTLTTTVSPSVPVFTRLKKRGKCTPRTTSAGLSSTVSSDEPSSTASEEPSSTSSVSEEPSITTSTSAPFPIATDCANVDDYSSACACLEPTTVTEHAAAVTSVIDTTTSVTTFSTSETVLTETITTTILVPATTTLTTTITTHTLTTTTVTSTSTPVPETFYPVLASGTYTGKYLLVGGNGPAFTFLATAAVNFPRASLFLPASGGSTPVLANSPTYKMYVRQLTSNYGSVLFTTAQFVSTSPYTWDLVTCSVEAETLKLKCATTRGFSRFLQCATSIYFANTSTPAPGGCTEVELVAAAS